MKYLILDREAATILNVTEAIKRGCNISTTKKWWPEIELADGNIALKVGNGEGLSDEQLKACVDKIEIPNE